jgi:hypothetical protein
MDDGRAESVPRCRSATAPLVVIGEPTLIERIQSVKYMMLIGGEETSYVNDSDEERAATYERLFAWWEEHERAGRIIGGHELQPSSTATTVRIRKDGNVTVTDGPFVEGKEMIGGYAILDVSDLDEALALAKSWPSPDTIEIRPIVQRD